MLPRDCRRFLGVALLACIALLATACSSSSNSADDAATGATVAQTDSSSDPHATMSADEHAAMAGNDGAAMSMSNVVAGSATGDTPCELSGDPASPGQTAGEHGERGLMRQVPLEQEARLQLQQQQEQARAAAARYPTVTDALAAGYVKSTPYVTCIGAHYTNVAFVARFDSAAPSELLFDGTDPDSGIVGLSYLVLNPGGPPEGFSGANDVWHQHNANGGLCLRAESSLEAKEPATRTVPPWEGVSRS